MDWLDLLAVQGTLKSLLQHHSSKASILRHSAFFTVQLSHPYMTTGKTIALTRRHILPYEKILVVNRNNGERLETYAIPGKSGSKVFCLNGPAAHKGNVGDVITIMAFSVLDEKEAQIYEPQIVVLDKDNNIIQRKGRLRI